MLSMVWRWPLLSRVRGRMRLQEEEQRECPTVYYRNVMPENLLPAFNFLISQIPYARVVVAEGHHVFFPLGIVTRPQPEEEKFYGMAFTTQLGLLASGINYVYNQQFLDTFAFVRLPKLGPDYYVGALVCLQPAGQEYTGMVVDVEGGIRMELPPEIAGVYSHIVEVKSALETGEDVGVVNNVIEGFIEGEFHRIIYSYMLDTLLVERNLDRLRTVHGYTPKAFRIVGNIINKTLLDITDSPEINASVARIEEFVRSIPGYTEPYGRYPSQIQIMNEDDIVDIMWDVAFKVGNAGINTTADYIKQARNVWRVTFPR